MNPQEIKDNFHVYVRKNETEMLGLLRDKCGDEIILDLDDNEDIRNLREFLIKVKKRVTLIKDHLVDVSLLYNINQNIMIPGIFVKIKEHNIELCVSADRLYLCGFKVGVKTYEAIEKNGRRIPSSENLEFGLSYSELGVDFTIFRFGYNNIQTAARVFCDWPTIADPTYEDRKPLKTVFSILIVMLIKTIRFHEVHDHVITL
ncbi:hypothetical protein FRX31_021870 [Thalictrum thalictroides]|uniref:rRNA N-glycosylase n=1 Tax=Thalictrum thalictroides TaxID=46969 RepID=A0A7J6VUK8_THATH|nr:hypothetical protein FRX31_021870 [Thalictrum thalictroides]